MSAFRSISSPTIVGSSVAACTTLDSSYKLIIISDLAKSASAILSVVLNPVEYPIVAISR